MATAFTLDELVFANRHRAYGAFMLRQEYRFVINRALWLGIGLFLLGVLSPTIYRQFFARSSADNRLVQLVMNPELLTPPKEKPIELPPIEKLPTQATVRSLPPIVVPEPDVTEEVVPPTVEELSNADPGDKTVEGTGEVEVIAPPEEFAPTRQESAVEVAPKAEESEFVSVEQQPEFPGGMQALGHYLQRSLRYPAGASRAGIAGKVFVSFVVSANGELSEVTVLKGIGFGCDEEALRVVKQMPRWKPGKQSGRAVKVRFNLPITFALE